MNRNRSTTIGKYLVKRLQQIGVEHMFGVPGDYVLPLFDYLEESPIQVIGNCNELNGGYAADAYARLNGVGAGLWSNSRLLHTLWFLYIVIIYDPI